MSLVPIALVVAVAAVQVALWSHARAHARLVATEAAGWVARSGVDPHVAAAQVTDELESDARLSEVDASAEIIRESGVEMVVVTVRGRAPGFLRGTSAPVMVSVAWPVSAVGGGAAE